jgi:hypothetical protein
VSKFPLLTSVQVVEAGPLSRVFQAMDLFPRDARVQTAACGAIMNFAAVSQGRVRGLCAACCF